MTVKEANQRAVTEDTQKGTKVNRINMVGDQSRNQHDHDRDQEVNQLRPAHPAVKIY